MDKDRGSREQVVQRTSGGFRVAKGFNRQLGVAMSWGIGGGNVMQHRGGQCLVFLLPCINEHTHKTLI